MTQQEKEPLDTHIYTFEDQLSLFTRVAYCCSSYGFGALPTS